MKPKLIKRGKSEDAEEAGKMFVGGLSWESSQESLLNFFRRWGEVVDCVVMKNTETGRSRGFGFVTFADSDNVSAVLEEGPHELDGRTIDPKPCNPRSLQSRMRSRSQAFPKVFLGGLPPSITETDLRNFFGQFGHVMEVVIMYDQEKRKSRGFGFLSFEQQDSVERVVSKHFITLGGKQVEVKRAEPRDNMRQDSGTPSMMAGGDGWNPPSHHADQWAGVHGLQPIMQWGHPHQAPHAQPYPPAAAYGSPAPPAAPTAAPYHQPQASWGAPTAAGWAYAAHQYPGAPHAGWPPQPVPPPAAATPDPYGRAAAMPPPASIMAAAPPPAASHKSAAAEYAAWHQQYGAAAAAAGYPTAAAVEYAAAAAAQRAPAPTGTPAPLPQAHAAAAAAAVMSGYPGYGPPMPEIVNYGQMGGPGPQRGPSYGQPAQTQPYHPYRHSPYPPRRQ